MNDPAALRICNCMFIDQLLRCCRCRSASRRKVTTRIASSGEERIPAVQLAPGFVGHAKLLSLGVAIRENVIRCLAMAPLRNFARVPRAQPEVRHDVVRSAAVLGKQDGSRGPRHVERSAPGLRLAQIIIVWAEFEIDVHTVTPRGCADIGRAAINRFEQIRPLRGGGTQKRRERSSPRQFTMGKS